MEATVRLIDGEPNVAVQVFWRGAELNLLRAREEPVERFLQRLGLSCGKHVGRQQAGGDRKRAKKEKRGKGGAVSVVAVACQGQEDDVVLVAPAEGGDQVVAAAATPRLLDGAGSRVPDGTPVAEALRRAAHVEIEGERLPIVVNPPSITKMEAFGRPLAGCPLTASLRCEFCRPEDFELRWLRQASAGVAGGGGHPVGEGRVLWVPEEACGQTLTLRADPRGSPPTGRPRALLRVGLVEEVPTGWPERRLADLGPRPTGASIRVVCYNILAVYYARTQMAVRDMYPYCPAHVLDLAYRQPLLGRELSRLDADLIFLQECGYAVFHKCLVPLFGHKYHARISLKGSRVSEGCALLIRKDAFEVLEEQEVLFRNLLRASPALRGILREVSSKWPDFLTGVLPHMSTVFQLSAVRHRPTGEVIVLANTHLFFHPLARHVRLLQAMSLLQQVQEMRERHRGGPDRPLPRAVVCGDLNCSPDTAAARLFQQGHVPSDHPDWDFSTQFAWRDDDEVVDAAADDADAGAGTAAPSAVSDPVDPGLEVLEPLPEADWQPGRGVTLQSPTGPLADAYAGTGLAFTNYVKGFRGTLDYILTAGGFRVSRTLPGVSEEDLRPEGGLPSVLHPSDHLSLAADLELVQQP